MISITQQTAAAGIMNAAAATAVDQGRNRGLWNFSIRVCAEAAAAASCLEGMHVLFFFLLFVGRA